MTILDFIVIGFLIGQGILAFCLVIRSDDFFTGDTTYFELAKSWLDTGVYGFNEKVESLFPPGFPAILALQCIIGGCRYAVMIHTMVIFATLGLVTSYMLLRRLHSRRVAATCCLLLASSGYIFLLATHLVFSDLPYWFSSLATLIVAIYFQEATTSLRRLVLGIFCGGLVVLALMLRSAAVALLVGLLAWLVVSCVLDWSIAKRRLLLFFPILLLGVVVQGWWMHWSKQHETLDWQLPGFPMSYVNQLWVKDGYRPEAGIASLGDLPRRVGQNLAEQSVDLMQLLTHKGYYPAWFSPLVWVPVGLILLGLGCSLSPKGGGWTEWYFLSYEVMVLLWPWTIEQERFLTPEAPLAGLYLWRGGRVLVRWMYQIPRLVGAVSLPVIFFLGVSGMIWRCDATHLSCRLMPIFWGGAAIVAVSMVWMGAALVTPVWTWCLSFPRGRIAMWGITLTRVQVGWMTLVILLGAGGLMQQLRMGWANRAFDITQESTYPDIEAAQWIQTHTEPQAVVMARQVDVVYHYSRRKVIWLPPLSNPEVLMEGIHKHNVAFVIVNERQNSYWLPPDQGCFGPLLAEYPEEFQLVHTGSHESIFAVVTQASAQHQRGESG